MTARILQAIGLVVLMGGIALALRASHRLRIASNPSDRRLSTAPVDLGTVPKLSAREASLAPSVAEALERIRTAKEPFLVARREAPGLRAVPLEAIAWARGVWERGEFWAACAVLEVVQPRSSELEWLSSHEVSDHPIRSAVAALARWQSDSDTQQLIDALLRLHSRVGEDAVPVTLAVLGRLDSLGTVTLPWLLRQLESGKRIGDTLALLQEMGPQAQGAVPVVVRLIGVLSAKSADPLFGVHEESEYLDDAVDTLQHLGPGGEDAVVRLLFSTSSAVSRAAVVTIVESMHRYDGARVLAEARRQHSPFEVSVVCRVLATLPHSIADWRATLEFVRLASGEGRLAFAEALVGRNLRAPYLDDLLKVLIPWAYDEDKHLSASALDVLARAAPSDPRVDGIVRRMLESGGLEEKADMLRRVGENCAGFSDSARAAALELANSESSRLRSLAIGVLASCPHTFDSEFQLGWIRRGLEDEADDVVITCLKWMSARGPSAVGLLRLAMDSASGRSYPVQLEMLRALDSVGASPEAIGAYLVETWTRFGSSPASSDAVQEGVVVLLERLSHRGLEVEELVALMARPEGLRHSLRVRLENLER